MARPAVHQASGRSRAAGTAGPAMRGPACRRCRHPAGCCRAPQPGAAGPRSTAPAPGGGRVLKGGRRGDTHDVRDTRDPVHEQATAGIGTVPPDQVDHLAVVVRGAPGTGNSLPNPIAGTSGSQIVDGGAGTAVLTGGSGGGPPRRRQPPEIGVIETIGSGAGTATRNVHSAAGDYRRRDERPATST